MQKSLQTLTVLHTNDIHSHFEQMPKIAAAIRQIKRQHPDSQTLVVDCGDHMDRVRLETEGSGGTANIAIMNATGYEMAVLGNNEGLTFTPQILRRLYADAAFDVLGSNIQESDTGTLPDWMKPYRIVRKGSLKVAVIGLTVPFTSFYRLLGWDLMDPFETARSLVAAVREQADIVIVLSHLGLANDERLAREIPGIDLILGGHTHHLLEEPLKIGDTYLCATGKFGRYLGVVELAYDGAAKRIIALAGRCIEVDSQEPSDDIVRLIAEYRQSSKTELSEIVAVLEDPLPIEWSGETTLGNMMAAGLKKWTKAEIGLVNAGQMLQGLHKGGVTRGELHRLCPSPVNPCSLLLKGEHLWRALEESLLEEFQQKQIRGFGFRGERLGMLCFAGLSVEYDESRPPYGKIERVIVNGEQFDLQREYTVGTIDMFTFGIGYPSIREGRDVRYFLPELLRDVLLHELLDGEAVEQGRKRQWISIKK